jgi:curved DNA-binding protein CbpA
VERSRSDYYRDLQVDPAASPLVIQAAYRVLAQIFHPDVSGDDAEMKRINAAWEVLGDARRRKQYDIERAGRHAPQAGTTGHAPSGSAPAAPRPHAPGGTTRTAAPTTSPSTTGRPDGHAGPPVGPASGSTIRFGRYEGWTIGQVARADPPFLEWLRRVPLGRALKPEIDLALQRADGARRMGIAGAGAAGAGDAGTPASNDQPVHTWAPGAPTRVR